MDSAKIFIVGLIVLAVTAIAVFISLNSIVTSNTQLNTRTISSNQFGNNTIVLNHTGNRPASLTTILTNIPTARNFVLTSVIITNRTGGEILNANNYSVATTGIITYIGGVGGYNGTNVNVSAVYTYDVDGDAVLVQANITNGTTNFFKNIPTVFVILGAVLIIATIVLIVVIVSRFSNVGGKLTQ